MQRRIRVALATAAAAALTGALAVAAAGPAAAVTPAGGTPGAPTWADGTVKADFNGDGYGDVAASAPLAYVSGHKSAGVVTVAYGSAKGLSSSNHQTLSQNSSGVPGTSEAGDFFGGTTAIGDFNGDGYTDLVVGTPDEKVGSDTDGGTVAVLWGSKSGLRSGTTIADPNPGGHDFWGNSLAAGDFDGDGKTDLAVGSSSSYVYVLRGGITSSGKAAKATGTVHVPIQGSSHTGAVDLTAGDVNGDGKTDLVVDGYATSSTGPNVNYLLYGGTSGLSASSELKLSPGLVTAIGDINGDGYGDMVIGESWDSGISGAVTGGKVAIRYGSASGPGGESDVSQNTGAVPGSSEKGDAFGWDISLGDINGDGYADLAIGAPGEDIDGVSDAGSVTVAYGSASGIDTASKVQYFHQNTAGVPGSDQKNAQFGADVKLTDVSGDGHADLTVGVEGENSGNGRVISLRSSGTAISASGAADLSPTSVGVSTTGTPLFGAIFGN
jgi:hypothetical protein